MIPNSAGSTVSTRAFGWRRAGSGENRMQSMPTVRIKAHRYVTTKTGPRTYSASPIHEALPKAESQLMDVVRQDRQDQQQREAHSKALDRRRALPFPLSDRERM
jgi:hypothetical protein